MTETSDQSSTGEYTQVSVPDEGLPADLRPGEDNPLAEAAGDDEDRSEERQDLGDPHIDGLQRDEDDRPVAPDTDASADAHHGEDADADSPGAS